MGLIVHWDGKGKIINTDGISKSKHLRSGVWAMLVVQVDRIDAETLQAVFARRDNILGFAVRGQELTRCVALKGKLGTKEDFVTLCLEDVRQELFIFAVAVNVSRIPKRATVADLVNKQKPVHVKKEKG